MMIHVRPLTQRTQLAADLRVIFVILSNEKRRAGEVG